MRTQPLGSVSHASCCLFLLLAGAIAPLKAGANPNIRSAFFAFYPNAVGTKLDNLPSRAGHCGVCHYDFKNGGNPWNPYGQAIRDIGGLNSAAGRSNAVWTVRNLDPESDGYSAQTEITDSTYGNTPTFPGLSAANLSQVMNIPQAEIQTNLTPAITVDTTPPTVVVLSPNGGEIFVANRPTNVSWSASDASGIAAIHLYESLDNGITFTPIALGLPNTGSYSWVPPDRPSNLARLRVVAVDGAANRTNDVSNAPFAIVSASGGRVPTTLRDFDLPGTQPFEGGSDLAAPESCASCHGGYNAAVEPYRNWQGSMMAHASRDPLFEANLAIANQDAPNSGDLCLRCHMARGWLAGRSVPPSGTRLQAADLAGVSCDLCHRMVDPVFVTNNPPVDALILAALSFPGTNYGSGMFVIDPSSIQRGPLTNPAAPHNFIASSFHRTGAFCGTCHDVSNPAFTADGLGHYPPNSLDAAAAGFSPQILAPVERTYSEWLHSEYNTPGGVYAPAFAGGKPDGRVAVCQDCHMRDVTGFAANPTNNPSTPLRQDLPLHDLTGGSTWLPGLLTNLYPGEVNAPAIQAGIARATYLLQSAANIGLADAGGQLKVTVTNETGHKLPTGYPEGRRIWINVRFYDDGLNLLAESGAYNATNGVLTRDAAAKIYETHPGIDTNISELVGLAAGPSLHFVLNNRIYEDNRIPPRGFTNAAFATFGGAPVGYSYEDGQYWDDTFYVLPAGASRAEVRLYYQSTSKEFVEFLRDENTTSNAGLRMYELWRTNGMCPPTLMAEAVWVPVFELKRALLTAQGKFRAEFRTRPGVSYAIEYRDSLDSGSWQEFAANGSFTATNTLGAFEDDFSATTSGAPPSTSARYYRFRHRAP
jgi:hypothetical protein